MNPLEKQSRVAPVTCAQQEAAGTVAVRSRTGGDGGAMALATFIPRAQTELNPQPVSSLGS